jgi:hypothetical protein
LHVFPLVHYVKRKGDKQTNDHSSLSSLFSVTIFCFLGGVRLIPLGTLATVWATALALTINECGVISGMKIGRGNRSTQRKSATNAT